jgi:Tol biopolymer transport system component
VGLTNETVTQVPTPSGTEGIISDGKYVFAGNQTRSELLVVDPKNDETVKKLALDQPSSTPAVSPDGRRLHLTVWNLAR